MRTQKNCKISAFAAAALAGALALSGAGAAQAQGISGVTNCAAPGGKQEGGALLGAVLGGVIGNKVAGNKQTLGTVVGAGVGAAAGSAVGCKLQHNTAQRAQGYGYDRAPSYNRGGYNLSGDIVPANYSRIDQTFVANRTVNLRAAPTTNSGRVGSLRAGERFQALANVRGSEWILVGQNGVGVGYVHAGYVQPNSQRVAYR